jgi:oligopeptide transport system permease protein
MIPVLLLVALITFVMMHQAPGGPWDRDLSRRQVDAATQEALNKKFGLDKPLFINLEGGNPLDSQFLYLCRQCHSRRPRPLLSPARARRGRYSLRAGQRQTVLGQPFWLFDAAGHDGADFGGPPGIPLGILAPLKRNTIFDYVGPLCVHDWHLRAQFCAGDLFDHRAGGAVEHPEDHPARLEQPGAWSVPAIVLGFGTFAYITRLTRNSDARSDGAGLCAHGARQGAGRARHHHAAHAAQRADPGDDDHGAGAGGLDHRLLHHRDHVRFSGQRARICDQRSATAIIP